MNAPLPPDEPERLKSLRNLAVLDTPPEAAFDDITQLAAQICETPIALISLVDESRQWFKSRHGIDATETPRRDSFCAHAISQPGDLMEVRDAQADARFADNALVTGEPHIRFYAGAPLVTAAGHALGTLCVIDRAPRELSAAQATALRVLSRNVVAQLELRWQCERLTRSEKETARLLALEEKSRRALLSVLEDEQRAGKELRKNKERVRRLVESNIHGVVFWNKEGGITEANDAFLEIVGYTREDLAAGHVNWITMTAPEFADQDARMLQELAKSGVCPAHEKEYVRNDGSRVPVLVGAATFRDAPHEGVSFVVDLTERKKLEQQFLRSQRMESIGTLAGGIAHDLNNVLGPIMMAIDLLRMKFTDAASAELLDIINSSARHGAEMVRQVLSFGRGVEGRRMEVQIRHLVSEIEKTVNDTFLKNIRMHTDMPPDLWTVTGDPTQLHQVLMNLCVNARDAMPTGGALNISAENVTLDAHYCALNPEAAAGPHIFIEVADTGAGMPSGVIDKIFDPFFTTKEVGKGTGLGLSTSLAIVKSHGGFIRVHSEPGRGTKFHIHLPAQTDTSPAEAVEADTELPRGNGELILVVDDEAAVRQITRQTLEAFGYRVLLASDGAEAAEIYAARGADIALVLTDMMMPVMDGPATIHVLRTLNPAARFIAASGLSTESHAAKAASLGVKEFLPKPYTANALLTSLKRALPAGA